MNIMKYKGYSARIEYSAEDECLVGRVLGIRSIIGFHGESVEEVEREFRGMIDFYLECCKKDGRKPERPAVGKVMVDLPLDAYLGVSDAAEEMGKSIADLVVSAVKIAYPYYGAEDKPEQEAKEAGKIVSDYVSSSEAAEMLGVSVRRISALCKSGRFPGAGDIGGKYQIPRVEVEAYRDSPRKSGRPQRAGK